MMSCSLSFPLCFFVLKVKIGLVIFKEDETKKRITIEI